MVAEVGLVGVGSDRQIKGYEMNQILYNVTIGVSEDINEEWLQWMRSEHIPSVLRTRMFISARLLRMHADSAGDPTYAVQYICQNMESYEHYQKLFAPALKLEHDLRFPDKAPSFRTVLEVLDTFQP